MESEEELEFGAKVFWFAVDFWATCGDSWVEKLIAAAD
ncbi:hypothetical protein H4W80_005723 [Nonomuraea angiospora]|uniref:Uncharacterized protein n=1 Tax=Nonomuraea angiospora TaxID=46172 RepID=A0ABR9M3J8_9ACTN|nr:hypothetical protein [Nonomuraea angiospora]